jgi:hypothetical protein
MRKCLLFMAIPLLAAGCGGPVADFRSASKVSFRECGDTTVGHACPALDTFDCVRHAAELCDPAHMTVRTPTTEGDLIVTDYFVVPKDASCGVVRFVDNTADRFGAPLGVVRADCTGFAPKKSCDALVAECPGT